MGRVAAAPATRRRARWIVALLAVVVGLLLTGSGHAVADPSDGDGGGGSNTYGFNTTCDNMKDGISNTIGIPYLGDLLGDEASAACKGLNAVTHPGDAVHAVVDKAWDSAFGKVVDSLMTGMGQAIVLSLVFWTKIPNAPMTDPNTLFDHITDYTYQLQIWLLALSVILSALRLGLARRSMATEHAEEAFKALARSTFATWIAGGVIFAAARLTDAFSSWVIDDATHGNAKSIAELMVKTSKFQAFSPGLVFILATVGILGALAMCVLTIVRQALMVVAVGIYPLAAAASGTRAGMQSFQKLTGWIIAFLLFKPIAALVYMIAFVTADSANTAAGPVTAGLPSEEAAQRQLVGVVLLCCVAFVLPAVMRLVAPVVAAVGSGGGGAAAAGAALVAGAAVATGGKALAAKGAAGGAGSGAAGFVGKGGATGTAGGGGGGGAGGGGGGGGPKPKGGGGGGASPSGAKSDGQSGAKVASAMAAGSAGVNRAGSDVTGAGAPAHDSWTNRPADLGRHRIAK